MPTETTEDPVPVFWDLLREAYAALEDADAYNVHSDDPASAATFNELVRAQDDAASRLVDHILKHHHALSRGTAP